MDHDSLLGAYRERFGLSQKELGALLGLSVATISNYETRRFPPLREALGLEIIFGKSLAALFPLTTYAVAQEMQQPLAEWSIVLEGLNDEASIKKRALISGISERLARILPAA